MRFAKLHGQGNDYIVAYVEAMDQPAAYYAPLARAICDRHYGVGSDGLALVGPPATPDADFDVRIFNTDGSEAEVSGNGVRCAAAYLHHQGQTARETLALRTLAGIKRLRRIERIGKVYRFEADMGAPILEPSRIPMRVEAAIDHAIRYSLPLDGESVTVTALSMGNPHCVLFCDRLDEERINRWGPRIEKHPAFPNRTNVEFIQVLSRKAVAARFWERGVGRTLSSGTSSSSAAVASILNGFTDERVTVETLAGPLEVEWRGRDHVFLTGPAEFIFTGEYDTETL